MNRQYIGARYVPKIFEHEGSNEWVSGIAYEPLTIVTYLNNSYTSKKPVPSNAGAPNVATEYWANTGNYVGVVSELTEKVSTLESNVDNIQDTLVSMSINAIDYGFKTDGSNNDSIMSTFIANDSDKTLYFPDGVYCFNSEITFPNECHMILSSNATLKLTSSNVIDYFITIRKGSTRSDYSYNSFIIGGTLDGNYKCNAVFSCHKVKTQRLLDNIKIVNVHKYGIQSSTEANPDGAFTCMNISIENFKGIDEAEETGTTGIYDNALDNTFINFEICNMETAIYTIAGRFAHIKAWIRSKNLIPNSQCVYCDGYDITIDDIAVDTYRYGFVANVQYYGACITNSMFIWNGAVYDSDKLTSYPPVMFKCSYPDRRFLCTNLIVSKVDNVVFSTVNLRGYSSFVNVQMVGNYNISVLGENAYSCERMYECVTRTQTTDAYGQISVPDITSSHGIIVNDPVRCIAVPIVSGVVIYSVDGNGNMTPLANTSVTIKYIVQNY